MNKIVLIFFMFPFYAGYDFANQLFSRHVAYYMVTDEVKETKLIFYCYKQISKML